MIDASIPEEFQMDFGNAAEQFLRRPASVAGQRVETSKAFLNGGFRRVQASVHQHLVVDASQENHVGGFCGPAQKLQHAPDIRSLVNAIAEENDEVVREEGIDLEERLKRFQVTVDVADLENFHEGFSEKHVGLTSNHGSVPRFAKLFYMARVAAGSEARRGKESEG